MIKITLKGPFASLKNLEIEIPDFTVLTGYNGAGKTHILKAIEQVSDCIDDDSIPLTYKKYITATDLVPSEFDFASFQRIQDQLQEVYNIYNMSIMDKNASRDSQGHPVKLEDIIPTWLYKGLLTVCELSNKSLDNLFLEDIQMYFPIEYLPVDSTKIFHQNLSHIFKRYSDILEENNYNKYRYDVLKDTSVSYISTEKFNEFYGEPPWIVANRILSYSKLNYEFKAPKNIKRYDLFGVTLVDKSNGFETPISDLSSGEKILLSLVVILYNAQHHHQLPQIILMDEPDAYLHPSMSKFLIKVIQDELIKNRNIKVIFSTHSPTTVALVPEESIYMVNRSGERVEKTSKDKAIRLLLEGVSTISLNHENRRQVFVESPYDSKIYEKIYSKLLKNLNQEISLLFIESGAMSYDKNGKPKNNCAQVISIVNLLRGDSNNQIWGIIDRDAENSSTDYIRVLGNGSRYSLENFIFDPLLVILILLKNYSINKEDLGLSSEESYLSFGSFSREKIQQIVDNYFKIISPTFKMTDNELMQVSYYGGTIINVPKWYLNFHGHTLENKLLECFKSLESIKKNDELKLKLAIVDMLIEDYQVFIPNDFYEVFEYIQNN